MVYKYEREIASFRSAKRNKLQVAEWSMLESEVRFSLLLLTGPNSPAALPYYMACCQSAQRRPPPISNPIYGYGPRAPHRGTQSTGNGGKQVLYAKPTLRRVVVLYRQTTAFDVIE